MKLINSSRFYLKGTDKRGFHLATVHYGVREFMAFSFDGIIYIEEATGGSLHFISDDSLAKELNDFLVEKGALAQNRPLISDEEWFNLGKKNKK